MDIIYLRNLRVPARIGIYDWEKAIKQELSFDLDMGTDIRRAAASDHIDDTLNYKAVAKRVYQFVSESRYELVETLAERVAELVMNEFQVPWVRLKLSKGEAVSGTSDVGIIIERGSKEA